MNILLVDDEEFILEYLEECICAMTLNIDQIFKATSVDEAVEIFNNNKIPIIITDIQMPEKSGLDFLELLNHYEQMPKTILLSGYSEFEFAQFAIQYNAADYLLKPIMEDELRVVLQKVIDEIKVQDKQKYKMTRAENVLNKELSEKRKQLLLDLLIGEKYTNAELLEKVSALGLSINLNEKCVIATIHLELDENRQHGKSEEIEIFENASLNIIEELIFKNDFEESELWYCKDFYNFINVVIPLKLINNDAEFLLKKLNTFKGKFTDLFGINLSVVLGQPIDFNQNLHQFYLKVVNQFLVHSEVKNNSVHVLENNLPQIKHQTLAVFNENPNILYLMENNRWVEVTKKIDSVLDEFEHGNSYSYSQLIEVFYYLYSCFSHVSHKLEQDNLNLISSLSLFHNPFNIHSTDQIRSWSKSLVSQFSQLVNQDDSGNTLLISQINQFIKQNIDGDVSLNKISDFVYLHPVYLSRLYKKQTSENISSYILRVRIEKAAKLLTTTNKRVYEIASEVGYQKTQYFINLFKETYQITPQKYREKFREVIKK